MKRQRETPRISAPQVDPNDQGTTASEAAAYAKDLRAHASLMDERRMLADVYDVASAIVETFQITDALVLTPEGEVNAYETARVALALAFEMTNDCACSAHDVDVHDYGGFGNDEARLSFSEGDTFHDQEELAHALRDVASGIRDEAAERPARFPAWQETYRATLLATRAKRRGKR